MRELVKVLTRIALLFIIALGLTETAYGQSFSIDSCTGIHYTDAMDKAALECLVNDAKKDSLLSIRDIQIHSFNKQVIKDTDIIKGLRASNEDKQHKLVICSQDKLKYKRRSVNNFFKGTVVGGLIVLSLDILLSK